uniref:Uncharacterized protein n=1 Tax=mine drainage metagenome TaxID=410659 RepID=E6PQC1_9ZZZZ
MSRTRRRAGLGTGLQRGQQTRIEEDVAREPNLSRKRRAAPNFLDPHGGRVGEPTLGALKEGDRCHRKAIGSSLRTTVANARGSFLEAIALALELQHGGAMHEMRRSRRVVAMVASPRYLPQSCTTRLEVTITLRRCL